MIPNDIHYLFPGGIYSLPVVFLIFALFFALFLYRARVLSQIASEELLGTLLVSRARQLFWLKTAGFCLTWICATLALMQPLGNGHYPPELQKPKTPALKNEEAAVRRKTHDVIFLIDTSLSMAATDTRTGVPRLDYAKEIADKILSRLKGENAALYAFTSTVTRLSPLTMDYLFVRLMLREMHYNEGDTAGSDLWEALKRMRNDYLGQATPELKTLILLSDGGDNQLEDLSGEAKTRYMEGLLRFFEDASQHQLRVYTIGLGSLKGAVIPGVEQEGKPVSSILEETLLQKLSQIGQGKFYLANSWGVESLAEDLIAEIDRQQRLAENDGGSIKASPKGEDLIYDLFFQVPLAGCLLFLAFALFFPDTHRWRGSIFFGLLFLFTFESSLGAADAISQKEQRLIREAEVDYEAQEYEKSRELFTGFLDDNLFNWQKERVFYNIGNTYMGQGAWESAALEYGKIDLLADRAFYLSRAVQTNQAVSAFLQACDLLDRPQAHLRDYGKAVFLLRQAEQKAQAAQEASSRFAELSGATHHVMQPDLIDLEQQAHRKLALAIKRYGEEKVRETTVKDGLSLIQASVKLALEHLDFLEQRVSDVLLKEKYWILFINEAESWQSLWDALFQKEEKLADAHQQYRAGIENMKEKRLNGARKDFLDARVMLADLTREIWGKDSLRILLQDLLGSYAQALDQMPVQVFSLLDIKAEQEQVRSIAANDREALTFLEPSDRFLQDSIASNQKAHYDLARFFLYEARQSIRRLLFLKDPERNTPKALLENAVENATHSLELQRFYAAFQAREERVEHALEDAESHVLTAATPFPGSVLEQEKTLYAQFCQCKPWNEVIPLFEKGWEEAEYALQAVKNKKTVHQIMHHQERVVTFWEEALEKLKQPQEPPPSQKQQPESSSLETRSIEETLRQLQTMDQQDRPKRAGEVKPKPGIHSW